MVKKVTRFFTIADYNEEEIWLRAQHRSGWRLVTMTPPCFFVFESCEPEDVVYRLDFKNGEPTEEYRQMARDFGWEYVMQSMGWMFFRKPAAADKAEGEDELFSDDASRADLASHILKTRYLPIMIVFLCIIVPQMIRAVSGGMGPASGFFGAFFGIFFGLYVYLMVHCGIKLKSIRDRAQN